MKILCIKIYRNLIEGRWSYYEAGKIEGQSLCMGGEGGCLGGMGAKGLGKPSTFKLEKSKMTSGTAFFALRES